MHACRLCFDALARTVLARAGTGLRFYSLAFGFALIFSEMATTHKPSCKYGSIRKTQRPQARHVCVLVEYCLTYCTRAANNNEKTPHLCAHWVISFCRELVCHLARTDQRTANGVTHRALTVRWGLRAFRRCPSSTTSTGTAGSHPPSAVCLTRLSPVSRHMCEVPSPAAASCNVTESPVLGPSRSTAPLCKCTGLARGLPAAADALDNSAGASHAGQQVQGQDDSSRVDADGGTCWRSRRNGA